MGISSLEDIFRSNNFTVYLLSIVFSSCVLIIFGALYFIVLSIRCCLQRKVEKRIRMEAQAELEQEKKKKALQQQERIPIGATQHRSIDVSGSKSAVDVDIKSLEPGGIATMLQFDPYNFEEIEEEWTCNLNVNMRCWLSMELLYFVENILLLFVVYSIITYISSLVAFQYLHWGAGIAINMVLTIAGVIHGVRYRLIEDKLAQMEDLDNESNQDAKSSNTEQDVALQENNVAPRGGPLTNIDTGINNVQLVDENIYNPNVVELEPKKSQLDVLRQEDVIASSPMVQTPMENGSSFLSSHEIGMTGATVNIEINNPVVPENDGLAPLTKKKTNLVILREQDVPDFVDLHKYQVIEGPPQAATEESKKKKKINPVEMYFKSLQIGIVNRLAIFLVYLIIAMVVTIVLTSFFYGTCVCTNQFEFSTTFTRYVNSRENLVLCGDYKICSIVSLLPERPQSELIVKFFSESKPYTPFINWSTKKGYSQYSPYTSNCTVEDLNAQQTELVQRFLMTCNVTNLTPQTTYYITLGYYTYKDLTPEEIAALNTTSNVMYVKINSTEHQVTTFSDDAINGNITFVVSGEVGYNDKATTMLTQAVKIANPSFIAFSGNIAFDNGFLTCYSRWVRFLQRYHDIAVDNKGNMIPLLTAIGNNEALFWKFKGNAENDVKNYRSFTLHDVTKNSTTQNFYHFHRLLGSSSTTCSMMALDSHVISSHSSQVPWINSKLQGTSDKYRMAMYNMPLYPSITSMTYDISQNGRTYWEPLFGGHKVAVTFEGYDRTYKRTNVIVNGTIVSSASISNQDNCAYNLGTTFVGDGSMGADLSTSLDTSNSLTYFKTRKLSNNYKVVSCSATSGISVKVYDDTETMIDSFVRV